MGGPDDERRKDLGRRGDYFAVRVGLACILGGAIVAVLIAGFLEPAEYKADSVVIGLLIAGILALVGIPGVGWKIG